MKYYAFTHKGPVYTAWYHIDYRRKRDLSTLQIASRQGYATRFRFGWFDMMEKMGYVKRFFIKGTVTFAILVNEDAGAALLGCTVGSLRKNLQVEMHLASMTSEMDMRSRRQISSSSSAVVKG